MPPSQINTVPSPATASDSTGKRKAGVAGLSANARPIKRRASKACCCCRARKVRCDVVDHGMPCTNCRLDDVECVVTDSKRRKKTRLCESTTAPAPPAPAPVAPPENVTELSEEDRRDESSPVFDNLLASPSIGSVDLESGYHVPLLYQPPGNSMGHHRRMPSLSNAQSSGFPLAGINLSKNILANAPFTVQKPKGWLPPFLRPLPQKLQSEDVDYLEAKGALVIPDVELRTELIKAYIHYVHWYMPVVELEDFLSCITRADPQSPVSLLLFQAVMFAGTAFVSLQSLLAAGYESRKVARKAFFQRCRILYDFDCESDRISLVQSLLLMTYWYEIPDDQKDTWHWMGVSLSLAHTIGVHRNPANSNMDPKRQRLWKRVWWSSYTRDRLIALGMRRPTRIKDEDCDVPMLALVDFDIRPFSAEALQAAGDLELLRRPDQQCKLALMFVEKSKLCLCISHVLKAQYSVLGHDQPSVGSSETTMMLVPKKSGSEGCEVQTCDRELDGWALRLCREARYRPESMVPLTPTTEVLYVHRALLHMIYLTTSSALHRPHVLPSTSSPNVESALQEVSRAKVRKAAVEITEIAQDLYMRDLIRYLPTTAVTVILPAVIIHLLDIKCNNPSVRTASLHRFRQCMQILQRLREIYCSADFATSFLEAAIRKADIHVAAMPPLTPESQLAAATTVRPQSVHKTTHPESISGFHNSGSSAPFEGPDIRSLALTPPPDFLAESSSLKLGLSPSAAAPMGATTMSGPDVHLQMPIPSAFSSHLSTDVSERDLKYASTPPQSVPSENGSTQNIATNPLAESKLDPFSPGSTFATENMDIHVPRNLSTDLPMSMPPSLNLPAGSPDMAAFVNMAHDADITQNDLDALINFDDAGADFFFAGAEDNATTADDGLAGVDKRTESNPGWFSISSADEDIDKMASPETLSPHSGRSNSSNPDSAGTELTEMDIGFGLDDGVEGNKTMGVSPELGAAVGV